MTTPFGRLLAAGFVLFGLAARAQVVVPPTPGRAPDPATNALPKPMAQPAKSAPYGPGMKINISADGSKYVRLMTAVQFWSRYTDNNTGTVNGTEEPVSSQVDFGIRRARLLLVSQLNSRFVIVTQLGINSQSTISGGGPGEATGPGKKATFYMHDAMLDYKVNKYLSIGGGLHAYNGISRQSSFAAFSLITLDVPGTQWPVLDAIDQTGRGVGLFGHGRVGKFDYRLSVNDAFKNNTTSTPATLTTGVAQFNPRARGKVYQGYFAWEFLEKEANLVPFPVGTYLGSKRVFNLGTGFLYYANGLYVRDQALPTALPASAWALPYRQQDLSVFAADVFFDTPVDTVQRTAFTFYGAFYKYNMGSNLVRYAGNLNPGYGSAALRGNAVPVVGTGTAQTLQTGFLLPQRLLGPKARLQPYASYTHGHYEGLRRENGSIQDVHLFDGGVNVLLDGHQAKITLNYRARPDFTNVNDVRYRPEVTMQMQAIL
ncbi:hypothetical protein [Hymenobacter nivis]|uniref:Porin n=1 Tax=Hymenobacter nivis TaxID=1850093 RepID=A0A502GA81_9BACT|nr:hypothetical protein [Hymenobacter nivis]TPG58220.1 hypothetical protein EAH73_22460 [Hymenobacter nivis]